MITLGLVDDEPLFSAGLSMLLEAEEDMQVIWQAANGLDAIERARHAAPDVLLLDIHMPFADGVEVTEQLLAEETCSKIIILTTFGADEFVLRAIAAGASGFLLKNSAPDRLIEAVRTVHRGDSVISPGPAKELFSAFRNRSTRLDTPHQQVDRRSVDGLTPREQEVLTLVSQGLTNTEICERLWLSMPTVKTHMGNLLAKTDSRDRVQLVLYALRNIDPTH